MVAHVRASSPTHPEHPILFSVKMVRAVLNGRKTQTRRLVNARHPITFIGSAGEEDDPSKWGYFFDGPDHNGYMVLGRGHDDRHNHGSISIPCPYGVPGDRLWVRETWGLHAFGDETDWERGSIRGCTERELRGQYDITYRADWGPIQEGCCWRPGIYMPRWASRITLESTAVRVQRLQDISDDDARAEGVDIGGHPHYRSAFAELWGRINDKRAPWDTNPWVWAITFRAAQASRPSSR